MQIESIDWSEVTRALERMASSPDAGVLINLESLLATAYGASQAAVHIDTGSLKGSGKMSSRFDGGVWTGEISYGGSSPAAVHNPVKYAIYEAARDGTHDFSKPAVRVGDRLKEIMKGYIARID